MAAGPCGRRALHCALVGFVTQGEGVVRRADQVAPLATDANSGGEEAALLIADAVLAVGCMTSHDWAAEA